jgi:hypothetical protein
MPSLLTLYEAAHFSMNSCYFFICKSSDLEQLMVYILEIIFRNFSNVLALTILGETFKFPSYLQLERVKNIWSFTSNPLSS